MCPTIQGTSSGNKNLAEFKTKQETHISLIPSTYYLLLLISSQSFRTKSREFNIELSVRFSFRLFCCFQCRSKFVQIVDFGAVTAVIHSDNRPIKQIDSSSGICIRVHCTNRTIDSFTDFLSTIWHNFIQLSTKLEMCAIWVRFLLTWFRKLYSETISANWIRVRLMFWTA